MSSLLSPNMLLHNNLQRLQHDSVWDQARFFSSGIPGILAHMENGRLAQGAQVNRCDLCQRYPSDEAAFEKLRDLGHVSL